MQFWSISSRDVELLKGGDGADFRDFVNRLICSHLATLGIPTSTLATDSRNVADGGVDTEVRRGDSGDPRNYVRQPTCWQFKATSHTQISELDLRNEIKKAYSAKLIQAGYGYRFCIADSVTAEKQATWEDILKEEAEKLCPMGPVPLVLTATSLAEWASQFPAIVCSFKNQNSFRHLHDWRRNITAVTKRYVPVSVWEQTRLEILRHVDFRGATKSIVFPVHGDAGIGKTRLVFETLFQLPEASSLVIYSNDEQAAQGFASFLSKQPEQYAILVVDECSLESRMRIENDLRGHEHRVRVIAIANYSRPNSSPEASLRRMPNETVEGILAENFPEVNADDRRVAVHFSGGFVKIAADICQLGLQKGLQSATDYYDLRVDDVESQRVMEAISLVLKIGFCGEVSRQFDDLCSLTGLKPEVAKRCAKKLKESPGFVAIGGRFFYTTPEAIARVSLERAWKHLVADNPQKFFSGIPPSLIGQIQARVAHSGSPAFRSAIAHYFRDWTEQLVSADLGNREIVERLVALVETNPSFFLPRLVHLVEGATPEELLASTGNWSDGSRRVLVWLCERLSSFPETFFDVERILFRLALFESEHHIGNNATSTWCGLYAIYLSGSALPYQDRLGIIDRLLHSKVIQEARLALQALGNIFETHATRMVGPTLVAGRVPPEDWSPRTQREEAQCFQKAFALYEKILADAAHLLHDEAYTVIISQISWFIARGHLTDLRHLLALKPIGLENLAKTLESIDMFLLHLPDDEPEIRPGYASEVEQWRKSLIPSDFHANLVSVLGRSPHHMHDGTQGQQWVEQIAAIAMDFCRDHSLLESELQWLEGNEAQSAMLLGEQIGSLDADATLLRTIIYHPAAQNLGLSRGYVVGLIQAWPNQILMLNQFLDWLEDSDPALSFGYAILKPNETNAIERWRRLVDTSRIPAHFIRGLIYSFRPHGPNLLHYKIVLPRLIRAMSPSDADVVSAALQFVHSWIQQSASSTDFSNPEHAEIWEAIGTILECSSERDPMAQHYWREAMKIYLKVNRTHSVTIAIKSLIEDLTIAEAAEQILLTIAKQDPALVVNALGSKLLEEKSSWKLQVRGFRPILEIVPSEVVMDWLHHTKVQGARKIVRSLPKPTVDEHGELIVPEVTLSVLEMFGDDADVANGFMVESGFRSYSGNITYQKLNEAEVASRFITHPNRAIRTWAQFTKTSSEQEAEYWRQGSEEDQI